MVASVHPAAMRKYDSHCSAPPGLNAYFWPRFTTGPAAEGLPQQLLRLGAITGFHPLIVRLRCHGDLGGTTRRGLRGSANRSFPTCAVALRSPRVDSPQ